EKYDDATKSFNEALDLWKQMKPPLSVTNEAEKARTLRGLGNVFRNMGDKELAKGDKERAKGDKEQAIRTYQEVLEIQKKLVRENQKDDHLRDRLRELAVTHGNLGAVFQELGEVEKAKDSYEQAESIQKDLVKDNPRLTRYKQDLARTYY